MTLKRRTTSTIPFGYRESDVEGFLEPIDGQLEALQETKEHIMNGSLSLRGAAEQLSYKTGRILLSTQNFLYIDPLLDRILQNLETYQHNSHIISFYLIHNFL